MGGAGVRTYADNEANNLFAIAIASGRTVGFVSKTQGVVPFAIFVKSTAMLLQRGILLSGTLIPRSIPVADSAANAIPHACIPPM